MIAAPTTGFVIDAMRNMVPALIGCFDSRSITPCADRCAILPRRATTVTAPARSPAAMRRWIISLMRCSRGAESPTSSGLPVGAAVTTDKASTQRRRADVSAAFMRDLLRR